MAKISPFRGVLYNKKKIKDFETIVSPPYDVISPSMREELYKANRRNIVRIILGKELTADNSSYNKYTRAAGFINQWLKSGVLKKDKRPAIYVYEQKYLHKGKPKSRVAFISLMKIEDPETGMVLPHEHTFSKPKEDRLNLIRAAKANTEPIFCVFEDADNIITDTLRAYCKIHVPVITVRFEGVENRIWALTEGAIIRKIEKGLDKKQVFIADGHHRYEVSLAFRDEMRRRLGPKRAKRFENIMVYFSSLTDDNLTILSTYRVVKSLGNIKWREIESKLKRYFYIENVNTKDEMFNALETAGSDYAFGVFFKDGRFRVLKLKDESILDEVIKDKKSREWRRLNVTVLHFLVFGRIFHIDPSTRSDCLGSSRALRHCSGRFAKDGERSRTANKARWGIEKFSPNDENILYTRDEDYAIRQVAEGECEIAFFQLPAKMSQIRDIAGKGDRMPHKSTYFYPKPLSGLVMNKF